VSLSSHMLCSSLLRKGFLRGVFLANHLAVLTTRTTKRKTQLTQQHKSVPIINSTKHTKRKPMLRLRERTDRAWFSCHLRHPARKRSGSILSVWSPQGFWVPARTGHIDIGTDGTPWQRLLTSCREQKTIQLAANRHTWRQPASSPAALVALCGSLTLRITPLFSGFWRYVWRGVGWSGASACCWLFDLLWRR